MSRGLMVALAGLAAAVGVLVLYRWDPATAAFFPPCPFHALTGLYCPGCGSLRAFHALLHGDVRRALAFNPLTTAATPLLFVGTAREACRLVSGADPFHARVPAWSIRALLVLILAFAVLRNIQAFSWLAPH